MSRTGKENAPMRPAFHRALFPALLGGILAMAACGPAAAPTATSAPATPTTAAKATATTAPAATATTGAIATVGGTSVPATATVGEVKVRPIPVLKAPAPNPLAQKGGTFRWLANQASPDRTVWASGNGNTLQTAVMAYGSLLDRNEFEAGKVEQILPSLAYDWWTDQPGTTWTFKIQQNVKFTDGKDLTCADAKFSLETIRDGRDSKGSTLTASPRSGWLKRVKDVRCADNFTLVVQTDGPLPSLPATLAVASFAIMPRHIFEGHLDKTVTQVGPGQGPFMLSADIPGESLKYKRNTSYWNQPYPYLDEFQYTNLGSTTAVTSAYRVGRGERGSATKAVREQLVNEGKIRVFTSGAGDGFAPVFANWQRKPWNDKRFSLAMRCAVDGGKYIKTVLDGEGFEVPIFPLADQPGGSDWSLTKEEWKALGPCYGPSAETNMEQRKQIAKDLLAQLGFTAQNPAKPKGLWRSDSKNQWVALDDDLRQVGIFTDMEFLELGPTYEKAGSGDFDIGSPSASFVTSRRDPDHWYYEQWYSTADRNYGRYTNAEVDALIDKQSKSLDPAERRKLIKQIDTILLKDNAKIVVATGLSVQHFAIWVNDIYWGQPSNSQNTAAKLERVWIDAAKMKQVLG